MLDEDETPLRKFIVDSLRNDNANCLYFQVADVLPVQNLMENLIWALVRGASPNRRSICQITMGLLFMQLLNVTDRLASQSTEEAAIVRVLNDIEGNYRTGSLTEIARQLHYDISWLSREIKHITGKTYKELLQEKRLISSCCSDEPIYSKGEKAPGSLFLLLFAHIQMCDWPHGTQVIP